VPLTPGTTAPAAGVVGDDEEEQARVTVEDPTVALNVAMSPVFPTVAVMDTLPGEFPSVTCVLAWPAASVVVAEGESDAVPLVTAKLTATPLTGELFAVTLTTSGTERA
jgi:hypothetical protein